MTDDKDISRILFQSTLPAWGATERGAVVAQRPAVSIHAPRVGSDHDVFERESGECRVSIHAPRVGSDVLREVKQK